MKAPNKQGTSQLGHANSMAVFNEVLFDAPVPRNDIARRTRLTPTSVSRITRQLIDAGLVEEFEPQKTGRPGRQSISLRLADDAGYVIGVAVNLFDQRISLANLQRKIIAEAPLPRKRILNSESAAETTAEAVDALLKKHRIKRSRVFGIGLASAGVADPEQGMVIRAPTLGWNQVPLGRDIEKYTGIPVRQTNLANAVGAAEYRFGIARTLRNFIVIHATLGFGMSVVVDGHFLRGFMNQAGLIGEVPVKFGDEYLDPRRELDAVAGGTPIVRKWLGPRKPSIFQESIQQVHLEELASAANGGDREAIAACQEGANYLGEAIITLATALSSEAVIFFGPMMKIDSYRETLEAMLTRAISSRRPMEVMVSKIRPVDAAYMLAISELANTGLHLDNLLRR